MHRQYKFSMILVAMMSQNLSDDRIDWYLVKDTFCFQNGIITAVFSTVKGFDFYFLKGQKGWVGEGDGMGDRYVNMSNQK